jgi:putative ABC transport system permease protein
LKTIAPDDVPLLSTAGLDLTVLAYMGGLAVLTSLLAGFGPAFHIGRVDANEALKQSSATGGGPRQRLRMSLIVAEISLAFVLLVAAGLMIRTLWNLLQVPAGFNAENVVTLPLSLSRLQTQSRPPSAFFLELMDRLRAITGVESVALTSHLPMGGNDSRTGIAVEGREPVPNEPTRAHPRFVSPEYFEAMGIRLLEGRPPAYSDVRDDFPAVVLVNRTAALKYWPGQSPVGRRIRMWGPAWREVIGVVDDVKFWGLNSPVNPELYLPMLSNPAVLVVRTQRDPARFMSAIRDQVRQSDLNLPVGSLSSMQDIIRRSSSVAPSRFYLILLAAFGLAAAGLAAVGIYGVVSCTVEQRTQEIGVRMALGAQPERVLRSVLWHGLTLALVSLAVGIAVSISLTRWTATLLFGVEPVDPLTFGAIAMFVVLVALAACYVPARRAAMIDPIEAVRHH